MHELTLEELSALLNLFHRAGGSQNAIEADLLARIEALHGERKSWQRWNLTTASAAPANCKGSACTISEPTSAWPAAWRTRR